MLLLETISQIDASPKYTQPGHFKVEGQQRNADVQKKVQRCILKVALPRM